MTPLVKAEDIVEHVPAVVETRQAARSLQVAACAFEGASLSGCAT